MKRIPILLPLFILGLLAASTSKAADHDSDTSSGNSKTECIGRYQINVPGEVEVAVQSLQHWFSENLSDAYRFTDDSIASFSSGPEITNTVSIAQFDEVQSKTYARVQNTIQKLKAAYKLDVANSIRAFPMPIAHSFAWQNNNGISVTMYFNSRIHTFAADNKQEVLDTLNSLHPRALYEIPKEQGVCFPYGFIADDGKDTRNIGVTMRLIDHPDVEIFFKDTSYPQGYKNDTNTPEVQLDSFWDGIGRGDRNIKFVDMDWHRFRNISMAGIAGKGTFVTITYKDGSTDYGYSAIAISDQNVNNKADNKMIYVIRTAARAKAKGIEPVSKDDIKTIAENIMASVKRHPVQ